MRDRLIDELARKEKRSRSEILEMLLSKIKDFGGLIDIESAAMMLAKERGLMPHSQPLKSFKFTISDLLPNMSNVTLIARVWRVSRVRTVQTRSGIKKEVAYLQVADKTGKVGLTLWNREAITIVRNGEVKVNDLVAIIGGYAKIGFKNCLELNLSDKGSLKKVGGEEVLTEEYPPRLVTPLPFASLKEGLGEIDVEGLVIAKESLNTSKTESGGTQGVIMLTDGQLIVALKLQGDDVALLNNVKIGDKVLIEGAYTRVGTITPIELRLGNMGRFTVIHRS